MDSIEQKIFSYIRQHRMLSPGDRVIIGVSGGADSVCLLFVLLEWAKRYPLTLEAVHVNHGIRREAGEDAEFVRKLCRENGVPFVLTETDVPARAREEKRSCEEMGRIVRYEALSRAAGADGKIAVAHNANDQAETMLLNLFRGSGLTGLCGIRPVRGQVIRPLLCVEREEIQRYLTGRGISWREDATNADDAYTRNRVRHHILPYADKQISRGVAGRLGSTAELLQETEQYLEAQTEEAFWKIVKDLPEEAGESGKNCGSGRTGEERGKISGSGRSGREGVPCRGFAFQVEDCADLPPIIRKRVLLKALERLSPKGSRDLARIHVEQLEELFLRSGNRDICLPCEMKARREYGRVLLTADGGQDIPLCFWQAHVELADREETQVPLPGGDCLVFRLIFDKKSQEVPENECTKWLDYDKIKESLIVRTRKTGDFLSIRGEQEGTVLHKSVKRYMIGEKIPAGERDRIPLVADGSHILWVVGYRISEAYKISKNTKRILQVQLRRDCSGSGMEEDNGGTC